MTVNQPGKGTLRTEDHHHDHDHSHGHDHHHHDVAKEKWYRNEWGLAGASALMLFLGLIFEYVIRIHAFQGIVRFAWYSLAYLPVGFPVVLQGIKLALRGQIFTEFFLMGIATIGAFYLGEYPEGVAVMLFYAIGELFQHAAVNRAKRSIQALLDVRPKTATVKRNDAFVVVSPEQVKVGESIQVKVGERVPLDGTLLTAEGTFNAAALTGESKPNRITQGRDVLAGMINEQNVIEIRTTRIFSDSSLARILTLVQHAQGRKAKTELFIRRFAKVYTPIVVLMAVSLTLLPYFFVQEYVFNTWLYRALIFLVISCPCALVVAIPLGYFGGIGAGSRNGILFKGSSYLDAITRVKTVVVDKTGTLTKGVFKVQQVVSIRGQENDWLPLAAAVESQSNHPIAKAIVGFINVPSLQVQHIEEVKGFGMKASVDGKTVLVGNRKLLNKHNVATHEERGVENTTVFVAVDQKFVGFIVIDDELKDDALDTVTKLKARNVKVVMLSGDKQSVVDRVARSLAIDGFGDLLPEGKVEKVESLKRGSQHALAFVGDGINDAPVLAVSDVGIAMGAMGSDAAIETADIVIQTDQPSKILTAIDIGKATNAIVWQNIALAFGVKLMVMLLGAWGVASMWEAVFADVGVALLAILNAIRIQRKKFN